MSTRIFAIAIVGLIVATVYAANSPVTVNLLDAKGQSGGTANLTQSKGGVVIRLNLKNLPPGGHASHIHSAAKCEAPAFKSAVPHFNPEHKQQWPRESAGTACWRYCPTLW